jgi:DNA-3-methyladenine glycosylase
LTERLGRDFYRRDALTLARALVGKTLVRRTERGTIAAVVTETEAYTGVGDPASHAYDGRRTARTETMYREGGYAYVYLIYGLYSCMNVTAAEEDNPEAVLIRAAVPIDGLDAVWDNLLRTSRRKTAPVRPAVGDTAAWARLLDGPGRLCCALGITKADDARDLEGDDFFLRDDGFVPHGILCRPRVGIDYAGEAKDWPYRFTAGSSGGIPLFDPPLA